MGCASAKHVEAIKPVATKPLVFFVLGGPGSGKGTQSLKLAREHGFVHLSAGDLLREEKKTESETAVMINTYIKEGKIVPGEVTVGLMKKAIKANGWEKSKYLIDGFPRNQENLEIWQRLLGDEINVPFILFLDANEDEMIHRILERAKTSGRDDDNMESLKKRFGVFNNETLPVVQIFDKQDKVRRVQAIGSIDEVYTGVKKQFNSYI